jgi:hemolysin III
VSGNHQQVPQRIRAGAELPLYTVGEEIAHALSHGLGLVLSLAGLVVLVGAASLRGDAWHIVGCTVFGSTAVLLYGASTLYHGVRQPQAKRILQRCDHAAIFLLIAGSYTPFALVSLRGPVGWTLLGLVWGLAVLGIALEAAAPNGSRRFSVVLHLIMGWLIVFALEPLMRSVHPDGVTLLVLGGVTYTLGVIFYAWERLPYNHAIWHVFVLVGTALHFSCVLGYVIPSAD